MLKKHLFYLCVPFANNAKIEEVVELEEIHEKYLKWVLEQIVQL